MVRLAEIIEPNENRITMDRLIDGELARDINLIYHEILKLSNNYYILTYEFTGEELEKINDLQYKVNILRKPAKKLFWNSKNSDALAQIEELELYFDWFDE